MSDNEWIELNIDNIPVYVRNDVETQRYYEEWIDLKEPLKSSIVYDIVEPTVSTKYRYRLKPLGTIQINSFLLDELLGTFISQNHKTGEYTLHENSQDIEGRKVEIIE